MTASRRKGELVCSEQELEQLRQDVRDVPWRQAMVGRWRARVDRFGEAPRVYVEKGLAFFDSCPECQAPLIFDPFAPGVHRCSRCGFDARGPEYDGAWHRQYHEWVAETAIAGAILYRLEGRAADAALVRHILLQYADNYERFPFYDNELGPTRIFQSTYLEALWLARLVVALDLIYPSGAVTPSEEARLRERLFYPSAAIIRSFNEGVSNRQAFNNVGLGAVALFFGDDELLNQVLEGPGGFAFHMRESVLADGLWYEGETYHFATLDHLLTLAEMCRRAGIDLYGDGPYGSLRPLFDAPLRLMYPDLTFPARKDSWFGRGVGYHKEVYEIGFSRYRDLRYAALLVDAYARGARRDELGWRGFLYAQAHLPAPAPAAPPPSRVASLPPVAAAPRESILSEGTGLAVLRGGDGSRYLSLEYGHYGGGHGHPDRLHINFFAGGRLWLGDPGTGWYHVPELAWYRSTLAHNTVTVDGLSQRANSEGQVRAFLDLPHLQAVQAEVATAYDGVVLRRTLCLLDDGYVDLFDVWADTPRVLDWVYQSPAELAVDVPLEAASLTAHGGGYEFLHAVRGGRTDGDVTAVFGGGEARFVVRIAGETGTEVFAARAPGIPLREETPMRVLLVRRRAARTRFAAWAEVSGGSLRETTFQRGTNGWFLVTGSHGQDAVYVGDGPGQIARRHQRRADGSTWIAWHRLSRVADDRQVWVRTDFPLETAAAGVLGEEVHLVLPPRFGRVWVHAPGAVRVLLNGQPVRFRREGSGIVVTQREQAAIVPRWPQDVKLYAGLDNELPVDLYRYPAGGGAGALELKASASGSAGVTVKPAPDEAAGSRAGQRFLVKVRPPGTAVGARVPVQLQAGEAVQAVELPVAAPVAATVGLEPYGGMPCVVCRAFNRTGTALPVALQVQLPAGLRARGPAEWTGVIPPQAAHVLAVPFSPALAGDRYVVSVELATGDYAVCEQHRFALGRACRLARGVVSQGQSFGAVAEAVAAWLRDGGSPLRLDRADQVSVTERPWGGPQDLSATVWVAWDDGGLWLVCRVRDDRVVFEPGVRDPFHNDGLQVYFDFRPPAHRGGSYTPGLAAYLVTALSAAGAVPQVHQIAGNQEISHRGARSGWFTIDGVQGKTTLLADGYKLILRFPYGSLGVAPPAPGHLIGFDVLLNDNDGTRTRRTQMAWAGAARRWAWLLGTYRDPSRFGHLVFDGE